MSACFPDPSHVNGTVSQVIDCSDSSVHYEGNWTTILDVQRTLAMFSNTSGDSANVSFRGSSIRVFGPIDPAGMHAEFILYAEDSQPGGRTCTRDSPSATQAVPLFDSGPLQLGLYTLRITNSDAPLFLQDFQVFTTSETTPTALSSVTLPPSPSPLSSSYTVSSYTEVRATGGSTTTITIQTTMEAVPTQTSHGPSRAVVMGGAMAGGIVFLFVLVGAGLWWRRRRDHSRFNIATPDIYHTPDTAHDAVTAAATKFVHTSKRPAIRIARGLAGADRSPEALQASPDDAPLPRAESERDSGEPSTPTVPDLSSVIPEPSSATDDGSAGAHVNEDPVVLNPRAVATTADQKPDTVESTRGGLHVQPAPPSSGPERSARETGIRDGPSTPRAGAVIRRLRIEEDSGVRLAGGRLGEARGEGVDSGEWEVLPPPYQEF